MRAMQAGGCPIGIYPAYYYSKVLPKYGFKVIETKDYKKGDIIVFPAIKNHIFGHIAIWNGEQCVSDFKQKSMFPASGDRLAKYQIFRYKKNTSHLKMGICRIILYSILSHYIYGKHVYARIN